MSLFGRLPELHLIKSSNSVNNPRRYPCRVASAHEEAGFRRPHRLSARRCFSYLFFPMPLLFPPLLPGPLVPLSEVVGATGSGVGIALPDESPPVF